MVECELDMTKIPLGFVPEICTRPADDTYQ